MQCILALNRKNLKNRFTLIFIISKCVIRYILSQFINPIFDTFGELNTKYS